MAQRQSTRELMEQLTSGTITRRGFVVRAAALGMSASAIAGLLAACGAAEVAPTAGAVATQVASAAPGVAATVATGATQIASAAPGAAATVATGATQIASAAPGAATAVASRPAGTAATDSPTSGGGNGIGAASTRELGKGGGLGPGPTKRGGSGQLKLLWWQAPTILNTHQAQGTKDFDAARLVLEPLANFGPDDKLVPFLAAEIPSVEKGTVAKDGTSVTWKLKSGVKWSDGQPFTSKDVAFTWKYATDKDTAAVSLANYENIASVETPDDTTAKITFKTPTPSWYIPFTGPNGMILPEHIFKDGMGSAAKNFAGNLKPIGTGPYKITDFKPGDQVTYDINPNWRDANGPAFDTVLMKGGGDAPSAARAVLQSGDYHIAWNLQIEPSILNQLQSSGKGRVEQLPNWGIERIMINRSDPIKEVNGQRSEKNTPHPFLADKAVRQALNLLCDRKTIAETLYGPAGSATANFLTQPAIYNSPNTKWEFNIAAAEKLLDDAGYKKSGQFRAKGDVKLAVVFQTSINSVRQKHQQIIKDAFEKAGIQVELKTVDASVYFSSDPGNPDTSAHFYADLEMLTSSPNIDPWTFMANYIGTDIAQKENSWNGRNASRWANKDYDTTLEQARGELDPVKRAQLFIKLNDLLINDVAVIPQIDRLGPIAIANGIKGLELNGWSSTNWNVANWTKS